jgi:hypothetical protein
VPVGIDPEHDAANGPHEESDAECREGQQQRRVLTLGRKKQPRDDDGEKTEADEVVPFERVADDGGGNLKRLRRSRPDAWTMALMFPPETSMARKELTLSLSRRR